MNKLIVGSGVAAGVVVLGVFAGYWHFAELLPRQQIFAPGGADRTPGEAPDARSVSTEAPAEGVPAPDAPAPTAPLPAAPVTPGMDAAPDAIDTAAAPSIELLRVEPDGSVVVAGRAAPGSDVSLMREGEMVASARASSAGDFAIALDEPLAVGDHELSLQSEGEDGTLATSAEAALVSVPERGREEDVLVALGAPNQPTRFLARPAAPQDAGAPAVSPDTGPAEAQGPAPAAAPESGIETAAAEPAVDELRGTVGDALSIAAVEIERDRIFIAGTARPGRQVRIYLDDAFIAQAQPTGEEFVAEARADVSVGSHRVRADEIGPDGTVVARVEVPFDRPEGESMAALAPAIAGRSAAQAPDPSSTPTQARPAEGSRSAPSAETASAQPPASPANVPATAAPPNDAPTTAAPSTAAPSTAAPPQTPPSVVAGDPAPAAPRPEPGASDPLATAALRGSGEGEATGETLRTQAALQPVEGRVIIRRGDTLWRISRETYGAGRRYTTIYLANGDQIRDPDLIYPGQIFRVPEDDAEETSALAR